MNIDLKLCIFIYEAVSNLFVLNNVRILYIVSNMEAKYKQIKESEVETLSSEQDGQQYIKA